MAVAQLKQAPDQRAPAPALPEPWQNRLDALRLIALQCRSAARTDLFTACALLSTNRHENHQAHARALMCCLRQAIQKAPIFFRPGTRELSFDEAWLIRALMACDTGDQDSFTFLIQSRVPTHHQRHIAFLLKSLTNLKSNLE